MAASDGYDRGDRSHKVASLEHEMDRAMTDRREPVRSSPATASLSPLEQNRLELSVGYFQLLYDAAREKPCSPTLTCNAHTPVSPPNIAEPVDRAVGDAAASDVAGARFGRFEVIRKIGQGGHSVVFLAHDPILNRDLALKVPRPEFLLTRAVRRFLHEGQAVALLNHPNVLAVYEAAEVGPVCYIAEAYARGGSLADWLERQSEPVSATTAAAIVSELAEGVDHAHSRGILHRDLKPSNVLLEPRELPGVEAARNQVVLDFVPKLADFGIAKILERESDETRTGAVLGTASYMSPEQAAGQNDLVGPASDVYGLGAILYELLTRKIVFSGGSYLETLQHVTLTEPVPIAKLRTRVPRDLDAICMKCLEKEPRRRYRSAFELGQDLQRFLGGEPTQARPAGTVERVVRWAKRKPTAAALIGVCVLGATALLSVCLWYSGRLSQLLVESEADRKRAEASERLALEREDLAMEHVYASRIATAQDAWSQGNMSEVEEILSELTPSIGQRDRRSIEWSYLKGLVNHASTRLRGHRGRVAAIAYSADACLLASGGKDGTVCLWNAGTHQPLRVWNVGENNEVNAVAFSLDGQTLAAAADDGNVLLWRVQNGDAKGRLQGHSGWVADLVFAADGKSIASVGSDKTVRLWDSETLRPTALLRGHTDIVRCARFVLGGALLATVSEDQTIRLWDVATKTCVRTQKLQPQKGHANARPTSLAVSIDGKSLAVCMGVTSIWTAELPGVLKQVAASFIPGMRCAAFSRDGKSILIGTDDAKLWKWDVAKQEFSKVYRGHREQILGVVASPHSEDVTTSSRDGDIRIWTDKSGQPFQTLTTFAWEPMSFDISPDGESLAVTGTRGETAILDSASGARQREWVDGRIEQGTIAYFADGHHVLTTRDKAGCRVWDIATGKCISDFPDLCATTGRALPAVEGSVFVAATNKALESFNFETRKRLARAVFPNTLCGLAFTDDGGHLAVGGHSGEIWICDGQDLHVERQLIGHRDHVDGLVFAHNHPWLCTRSDDYSVRLWDWQAGATLRTFANESGSATPLRFTSDDRTVLGTTGNGPLLTWNSATGRRTLNWEFSQATFARLSPDGRNIYVLNWSSDKGTGAIYVIPIDTSEST
jgi:WD40 repeat protein